MEFMHFDRDREIQREREREEESESGPHMQLRVSAQLFSGAPNLLPTVAYGN